MTAQCQKCGSKDIQRRYHADRYECQRHAQLHDPYWDVEHLHYSCRECGYQWQGVTFDKGGAQADTSAPTMRCCSTTTGGSHEH